jgi:hypothetical protein
MASSLESKLTLGTETEKLVVDDGVSLQLTQLALSHHSLPPETPQEGRQRRQRAAARLDELLGEAEDRTAAKRPQQGIHSGDGDHGGSIDLSKVSKTLDVLSWTHH